MCCADPRRGGCPLGVDHPGTTKAPAWSGVWVCCRRDIGDVLYSFFCSSRASFHPSRTLLFPSRVFFLRDSDRELAFLRLTRGDSGGKTSNSGGESGGELGVSGYTFRPVATQHREAAARSRNWAETHGGCSASMGGRQIGSSGVSDQNHSTHPSNSVVDKS